MIEEEELQTVSSALHGAIVVVGTGDLADPVAQRATESGRTVSAPRVKPANGGSADAVTPENARKARAVVIAVDEDAPELVSEFGRTEDDSAGDSADDAAKRSDGFVVAVVGVPAGEGTVDPDLLKTVREGADSTLLVPADSLTGDSPTGDSGANSSTAAEPAPSEPAIDGAFDFVTLIREAGFINLDLADAQTVLETGPLAALGRGSAALDERTAPETAVDEAFEGMPAGVDPTRASGVLIDVVGNDAMSVEDATAAVTSVRERVDDGAHVIWGGAVDETLTDEVQIRVVVADVAYDPTPTSGDPCPRCGASLSSYAFGDNVTLSCDSCSFADVSTSLE